MGSTTEAVLVAHIDALVSSPDFRRLESGEASPEEYDRFIASLVRTHVQSPRLVAFLYALSPPEAGPEALHNLLEELGLDNGSGVAHPALLRDLAAGAGLAPVLADLERQGADELRRLASEPLLYGTLREVGLAALCEVVAFELLLSRVAGRIGRALATHRGLAPEALRWFDHHAEVDVAHAEQGLRHIEAYRHYYGIPAEDARSIIDLTLRENVFLRRYFGRVCPAAAASAGR